MKKLAIWALLVLCCQVTNAQFVSKVQYLLEYNEELAGYDVSIYVEEVIGGTQVIDAVQGNATITIAVSKGKTLDSEQTQYQPLISTGPNMGQPQSWFIDGLISTCPDYDYYSLVPALSPIGRYAELNTGDTIRLFTVYEVDGSVLCAGEVRLFDNDTDPTSSDPCTEGSDLTQGISIGSALQTYNGNLPSSSAPTSPAVSAESTDLCIGATTELAASTEGVWTSLHPSIVNIFGNNTTASGLSPGTASLLFQATGSLCFSDTLEITVVDAIATTLLGPDSICVGDTTAFLTEDALAWSSSDPNVATINNAGMVEGIAPGTVTFIATDLEGCLSSSTVPITVGVTPTLAITGPTEICIGETTTIAATTGVVWESSNPAVASVNSAGIVTAVSAGLVTIRAISSIGCASDFSDPITVQPQPVAIVTGEDTICPNQFTTLLPNSGGSWSSDNTAIAIVNNAGIVTGISEGFSTLRHTDALTGCISNTVPVWVLNKVAGPDQYVRCFSTGSTYLQAQGTGIWTQLSGAPLTLADPTAPTNLLTDFPAAGDYVFQWSDGMCAATTTITVGEDCSCPLENNLIIPPTTNDYCSTEAIQIEGTYEDFTGLVPNFAWEIANTPTFEPATTVATTTDLNAVIDYPSLFNTRRYYLRKVVIASELDCSDTSNVIAINVTKSPDLSPISGSTQVCIGDAITLSVENIPNLTYRWTGPNGFSSTNASITIPDATELNAGMYFVEATRNGCVGPTQVIEIIVNGLAPAPTFGVDSLCIRGGTQIIPANQLSYELGETLNGTYTNSGFYTAVIGGIDSVRYRSTETGCLSEWSEPLVIIEHTMEITGDTAICIGGQTVLTSETAGTWTSSDEAVAIISDGGIVTGIGSGTATFTITDDEGCESYPSDEVTVADCNDPCQNINATQTMVSGTAYIDSNANGLLDATESTLANILIAVEGTGTSTLTDDQGYYELTLPDGNYQLTATTTGSAWTSNTITQPLTITGQPCIQGLHFGYTLKENVPPAVELHMSSYLTRCNTEVRFYVTYQNTGSEPVSGTIQLDIDDLTAYVSSVGGSVEGQLVTWEVEDLQPFQPRTAQVKLLMPAPILPFPVLQFEATFTEEAGSTTAPFLYQSLLRCSYDPNDKAVHPARTELENKTRFNEELLYTIRFQNNGNDTAFAVTIVDVLDENILTNSIRVRSSSHPVRTQIQEQVLTFTFPGIALVDSITNYEGSQGFVTFSCETADGLDENTLVTNTADIIFDMNPPIVTNTVENLMVSRICDGTIETQETRVICEGESYAGYTSSGVYTSVLTNFEGCDSLHMLDLTVVDREDEDVTIRLCPGNTAIFNGAIYETAGMYADTILGDAGCIATLYSIEVIALEPVAVALDTTICEGQSLFGFEETGTYEYTIVGQTECDSVYSIELTVLPADDPLCTVATAEGTLARQVAIYPNPAKDYVRIVTDVKINDVAILSSDGSSVYAPTSIYKSEYIEVSTEGLTSGMYMLSLTTDEGQVFKKLIIR